MNACKGSPVEVLARLRPHSSVTLPDGSRGLVMCQNREKVAVVCDGTVMVVDRWEVESAPVPCAEVEFDGWTDAEHEWFRRPVTEVVL